MIQMKSIGIPNDIEVKESNSFDFENNSTSKWVWVVDDTLNNCSECLDLEGTIYDNEEDAPGRPIHPNCGCEIIRVAIA